jgi:hypothetical protein
MFQLFGFQHAQCTFDRDHKQKSNARLIQISSLNHARYYLIDEPLSQTIVMISFSG